MIAMPNDIEIIDDPPVEPTKPELPAAGAASRIKRPRSR
jgi:hypothetical protein